jgi:hypothetical protein
MLPLTNLSDARPIIAIGIAILAGAVRGFSGYGSALVYVPLIASIYNPRIAAVTLLVIDFASGVPFAIRAARTCRWHEILPLMLTAAVGIPLGTYALLHVDTVLMRWAAALLVLFVLAFLIKGWRYKGRLAWWITWLTGFSSGFFGGALQMDGPPVVIFWLGGSHDAHVVRSNLMMFISLNGFLMCVVYWFSGLMTNGIVVASLLLGIPFMAAMSVGAKLFSVASESVYRIFAYAIIGVGAVVSLPIFDAYLR